MVQKVTNGIKISVKTTFNGTAHRNHRLYYDFNYFITIENISEETVQLVSRFWEIFDSQNDKEIVMGDGVVGQTPIMPPGDSYTYKSGCFLKSGMGAMKGFYTMMKVENKEFFKVIIPTFQLTTQISSN